MGVAGGIGVNLIGVTVKALLGANVNVNSLGGAGGAQSVNISAADKAKTLTIAGGAAGGFVGVAGGVDIGVLDVSVQAAIGTGATVRALADVQVAALSIKDVKTFALSIGGGFVGVAGSVSVWTVGTQATTTYEGSGSDGPAGPWDNTKADYHMGDVVTFGGKRYGAKLDNPAIGLSPVDNPTQWEGQKTPLKAGSAGQQRGTWTAGTSYDKEDVVSFNGKQYTAKVDNPSTSQNPEVNTGQWMPVRDAGDEADIVAAGNGENGYKSGLDGSTVHNRGAWSAATAYDANDLVDVRWQVLQRQGRQHQRHPGHRPDQVGRGQQERRRDERPDQRGHHQGQDHDQRRRAECSDGDRAGLQPAARRHRRRPSTASIVAGGSIRITAATSSRSSASPAASPAASSASACPCSS